jgi:type II secretory pathway component GspD/PulD (secretin)
VRRLLLALILCHAPLLAAEQMMEVISLQHRPAEQLIPILRPLVEADGTLTGAGDRLIVKTSPQNLGQIKVALAELDRALRQLRIWVKQSSEGKVTGQEANLSARYRSGDVYARVGDPRYRSDPRGASIAIDGGGGAVEYRHLNTDRRDDRHDLHHVLTVEGQPAFVNTGQSVPLIETHAYLGPYGTRVHEGVRYHDVDSGFYVLPRIHGDRVTLEINPQQAAFSARDGGVIDYATASTTITGRVGEWIDLGGLTEDFNEESHAILTTTRRRGEQLRYISVRVDVVP